MMRARIKNTPKYKLRDENTKQQIKKAKRKFNLGRGTCCIAIKQRIKKREKKEKKESSTCDLPPTRATVPLSPTPPTPSTRVTPTFKELNMVYNNSNNYDNDRSVGMATLDCLSKFIHSHQNAVLGTTNME